MDPPILLDPSGMEVAIEGSAFIRVRMEAAAAHDPNTGNPTFGSRELKPRLASIVEAENSGDFEAVLSWVLGVSRRLPFRVQTFRAPDRIVVDVGHVAAAPSAAGLPQSGERPAPESGAWPVSVLVAGMLLLPLGATATAVAVKRR